METSQYNDCITQGWGSLHARIRIASCSPSIIGVKYKVTPQAHTGRRPPLQTPDPRGEPSVRHLSEDAVGKTTLVPR